MYLAAWEYVFPKYGWAVAATALFVIVSQLKINVTNAYAGSLAWSNFFSRLTHSHPGRVVWMVFNTAIALVLMEMNVFQALGQVLGLYANIAIAWMMAVVADLVVNKPLGLSPPGIEFRRAFLYDINPVGVGAMGVASLLSVAAYLGAFGPMAQAFSAMIALVTAFVAAPLIAWATRGRWYLARNVVDDESGRYVRFGTRRCSICEREYEAEDMAPCPAYGGPICSLCCTLDARCGDLCKPQASLSAQWRALLARLLPARLAATLDSGLANYLLLMGLVVPALALVAWFLYRFGLNSLGEEAGLLAGELRGAFFKGYLLVLLVAGIVVWWLVLAHQSRQVAQEESNRQTQALNEQTAALQREIERHRETDLQLQQAKAQAESANQAKSRYVSAISHELRTPLNSILGYAQLLEDDPAIPEHRREALHIIRRGGDHLLGLIEGSLDIARIESGKLALQPQPLRLGDCVDEIAGLFELQAAERALAFVHERSQRLPEWVRADEKRLRQILINLLGNAVKFTRAGRVVLRSGYSHEMARFEIEDSGPGMTADELQRVFEPFTRGSAAGGAATGGTGLGLTIARMLTELMGGEMTVRSTPGQGTCFSVRLFLPTLREGAAGQAAVAVPPRSGYEGPRRRLLVVDNEATDRQLVVEQLSPLGFTLLQADSGEAALALLEAGEPVDAVFMDLAMPGIDGWEAIRRLRARRLTAAPVAIVSANAFDKGLDNDVGITPADFLVKPVRKAELLDWLGARLGLAWRHEAAAAVAPAPAPAGPPADWALPPADELRALHDAVRLGYLRGVHRALDQLAATQPQCEAFVTHLRGMARRFDLDGLARVLQSCSTP
jgi:signal transduction histidine kinase/CheY-like chemotaxis protein